MRITTKWLSVTYLLLMLAGCKPYRSENVLQERFYHIIETGEEVRFGEITDFEWDRVDMVGPYGDLKAFRKSNSEMEKIPRSVAKRINQQALNGNLTVFVFSLENKFVAYDEALYYDVLEVGLEVGTHYSPETILRKTPGRSHEGRRRFKSMEEWYDNR
ncbi:MAG: hypothetical protein IJV27_03285 [Prevotella sp.]|nr:hypothetical protein [Prevotella sp.]